MYIQYTHRETGLQHSGIPHTCPTRACSHDWYMRMCAGVALGPQCSGSRMLGSFFVERVRVRVLVRVGWGSLCTRSQAEPQALNPEQQELCLEAREGPSLRICSDQHCNGSAFIVCNIGALIIRLGFGGQLNYIYNEERTPQNSVGNYEGLYSRAYVLLGLELSG